jgi:glycosyltransferase involved in cell wall biosynthesis
VDLKRSFVFVLPYGPKLGGVEGWTFSMARRINEAGGKAFILSFCDLDGTDSTEASYPADLRSNIYEISNVNSENLLKSSFLDECVVKVLSFAQGDIVIIPNYSSFAYTVAVGVKESYVRGRVSIVGYLHADDKHYYDIARFFSPYIDRYVCVSRKIQETLQEKMPWRKNDFECRPCGIEFENENYSIDARPAENNSKALRIVYVGRLSEYQKRIFDLPLLVQQLRKRVGFYELHIIGDGEDKVGLKNQLDQLGEGTSNIQIFLHGKRTNKDVFDILKTSSIFFSCSSFEGASIALLESLALGCIPVVTDVSGVRDFIHNKANGFIFEVGNIVGAADLIEHIYHLDPQVITDVRSRNIKIGLSHTMFHYIRWFEQMVERLPPASRIHLEDLQRNWDYTWNPVVFQGIESHPFFVIYDKVKARWYGRYFIRIVKATLQVLGIR